MLRPLSRGLREAQREVARALARRAGAAVSKSVVITGRLIMNIDKRSTVSIGDRVVLNSVVSKNSLEARGPVIIKSLSPSARITIGPESGITSSTISAVIDVSIGARVLIGSGCIITDSDHHVVRPQEGSSRRHLGLPAAEPHHAVRIEDEVFIGARSIVLKGVTIGRGSVIGAGSVVSRDIAPNTIAAGNPCMPVGKVGE